MLTINSSGDVDFILRDDILIGEIRRLSPKKFSWRSLHAKPPYDQGVAKTRDEALAHIGCKVVNIKT